MRQNVPLHRHNIDNRKLQSLRRMERHQADPIRLVQCIDIAGQRCLFQKAAKPVRLLILFVPEGNLGQSGGRFLFVEHFVKLAHFGKELLHVGDPLLVFFAIRIEHREVFRLLQKKR